MYMFHLKKYILGDFQFQFSYINSLEVVTNVLIRKNLNKLKINVLNKFFLELSENSGCRANCHLRIWRQENTENHS